MHKTSVKQLMNSNAVSLDKSDTVIEAVKTMEKGNFGAVCVVDADKVAGIFTERDLLKRVIAKGLDVTTTTLEQAMTATPVVAHEDDAADEVYRTMKLRSFRHMPVISSNDSLIGMISMRNFEVNPQALCISPSKSDTAILKEALGSQGYDLVLVESMVDAINMITRRYFDLIIVDSEFDQNFSSKWLVELKSVVPNTPLLVIFGKDSTDNDASDAMKNGAYSFIIRPLKKDEITEVVQHCLSSLEPEDSGNEAMRYIRGGIRLEFPSRLELIGGIIRHTLAYLNTAELDLSFIRLAIDEAINNAIKHGNKCDESKTVYLEAQVDDKLCKVVIRDQGGGFNPGEVPSPLSQEGLRKRSGRGIFLMRNIMDEVTFNDIGNQVALAKHL